MTKPPRPVITVAAVAALGCLAMVPAFAPALAESASQGAASATNAEIADAPELDEASYEDLVADAQRILRLRGFDPGPVDGRLGLRTRQAIRDYQAAARSPGYLEALKGPAPSHGAATAGDPRPELVRADD